MSLKIPLILATVVLAAIMGCPTSVPALDGALDPGAVDERPFKFIQGVVSEDQGWRIIVNEGVRVRITLQTEVLDSRGRTVPRYDIKPGLWVYATGPIDFDGDVLAEKVYILPGRIDGNRLGQYPFIEAP
jgi:hypothetical protein